MIRNHMIVRCELKLCELYGSMEMEHCYKILFIYIYIAFSATRKLPMDLLIGFVWLPGKIKENKKKK